MNYGLNYGLKMRGRVVLIGLLALSAFAQAPKTKPAGANLVNRLYRMSPAERSRMFEKMPPERRKVLEARIEHLNQIGPEAREKLNREYALFQQLPPERQLAARQTMRQIAELSDTRRPMVRGAIRNLFKQPTEVQGRRMASKAFQERFNDDERKLIKDALNTLPQPEAGPQQ